MTAYDIIADRVMELCSTTGTGPFQLSGPPTGFEGFVAGIGNGNTAPYFAINAAGTKWERGYGVITDAGTDTLSRTLIKSSTGALISWVAGDAPYYVFSGFTNDLVNSLMQTHYGTSKPAWLMRGLWIDSTNAPTGTLLKFYDGANSITLGTINETTNTFTPAGVAFASSAEVAAGVVSDEAVAPDTLAANVHYQGRQMIAIERGMWTPRTTSGMAASVREMTTNKNMIVALAADQTTAEYVQWRMALPPSWDRGSIYYRVRWTAASGTGGVAWALRAVAVSDDDTLDVAFGTAVVVTDTLLAANDEHRTAESAALTVGGTPAAGDSILWELYRDPSNGSDTLNADAEPLEIELFFTTNAKNDA